MDKPALGDTLLVGEGDFSFCVAMVNKLPPDKHSTITATSLETDESIQKHQDALENIQTLQDKGVTVRLETDATRLHEDPYFSGKKYARIIFSFPHVGGKSNHKKNRKLLKDFFASAVIVLEGRGQVFMTLCKGQGGTPLDSVQRAQHDSWEVVAMAADADLILVKVLAFKADEYRTYSSTGFRSQDKGFNTDKAITHIFERAERVQIPQRITIPITIKGEVFDCPRYIFDKLLAVRSIKKNAHHPLNTLYNSLVKLLSAKSEICDLGMFEPIRPWKGNLGPESPARFCLQRSKKAYVSPEVLENFDDLVGEEVLDFGGGDKELTDSTEDEKGKYKVVFEREIARVAANLMFGRDRDQLYIFGCPVFQKSRDFSASAFVYCATIVRCLSQQQLDDRDSTPTVIDVSEDRLKPGLEENLKLVGEITSTGNDCFDIGVELKLDGITGMNDTAEELDGDDQSGDSEWDIEAELYNPPDDSVKKQVTHGQFYMNVIWRDNVALQNVANALDLVSLACTKYNIPLHDERLLFCEDYRVLEVFEELDKETEKSKETYEDAVTDKTEEKKSTEPASNSEPLFARLWNRLVQMVSPGAVGGTKLDAESDAKLDAESGSKLDAESGKVCDGKKSAQATEPIRNDVESKKSRTRARKCPIFTAPSLFALSCLHDMSFWENETIAFDEDKYFDVIRDVAGDNFIGIELIDTYTDPGTGRKSRCYRLIFQSPDQAMSYDTTWKLQSMIRLEVEKCMKVTLR